MTIAIGLRSNDGIVICADSQLTTGDVKTYDGKVDLHIIYERGRGKYRICFALSGAGDVDYIATAKAKLTKQFPECRNDDEMVEELERRWLEFFNQHLAPWAYFPATDRPQVELLIGVSGTTLSNHLFHCVGTAFHETSAKAIGSGVLLADDMLKRYTIGNQTVEDNLVIATYIIAKAKRGVEHCGGSTHMMALRKGGDFAVSEKPAIDQLERDLLANERETDKELVRSILAKKISLNWMNDYASKESAKPKALTAPKPQ